MTHEKLNQLNDLVHEILTTKDVLENFKKNPFHRALTHGCDDSPKTEFIGKLWDQHAEQIIKALEKQVVTLEARFKKL
jgi:hypothetical protein